MDKLIQERAIHKLITKIANNSPREMLLELAQQWRQEECECELCSKPGSPETLRYIYGGEGHILVCEECEESATPPTDEEWDEYIRMGLLDDEDEEWDEDDEEDEEDDEGKD